MKLLLGVIFLFPVHVLAQVAAQPNLEPPAQGQWLIDLAANHPTLMAIIVLIGSLRLVLKPLFALAHTFFLNQGLTSWDNKESAVEQSQAMKVLFFVLDYLGSVKMPVKEVPAPAQPVAPPMPPVSG